MANYTFGKVLGVVGLDRFQDKVLQEKSPSQSLPISGGCTLDVTQYKIKSLGKSQLSLGRGARQAIDSYINDFHTEVLVQKNLNLTQLPKKTHQAFSCNTKLVHTHSKAFFMLYFNLVNEILKKLPAVCVQPTWKGLIPRGLVLSAYSVRNLIKNRFQNRTILYCSVLFQHAHPCFARMYHRQMQMQSIYANTAFLKF